MVAVKDVGHVKMYGTNSKVIVTTSLNLLLNLKKNQMIKNFILFFINYVYQLMDFIKNAEFFNLL
jgi:hypothetical protein